MYVLTHSLVDVLVAAAKEVGLDEAEVCFDLTSRAPLFYYVAFLHFTFSSVISYFCVYVCGICMYCMCLFVHICHVCIRIACVCACVCLLACAFSVFIYVQLLNVSLPHQQPRRLQQHFCLFFFSVFCFVVF